MENQLMMTAQRIRGLRTLIGKSAEEMAEITGLTVENYIRCEEGKEDFSFTFLHKCAKAFHVDITDLLTGENAKLSGYSVVRHGEGMPIARREGFKYNHLAVNFKDRYTEPFWVKAPYEEEAQNQPIPTATHAGEEFDYILKGSLRVKIGDHEELLKAGDSIFYNSLTPHGMIAAGGEDCEFLAIIMAKDGKAYDYTPPKAVSYEKKEKTSAVGEQNEPIWTKFIDVVENEAGGLEKISFKNKEDYNFSFDVVDVLGEKYPDKLAMLHLDKNKVRRDFTFGDMKKYSSMTANYFKSLGIKKGDKVMLVLKRHYQFWFSILALHKIGAIAVPATNLLVEKDYVYRFNSGRIDTIVCTADGDCAHQVDLSEKSCPTLKRKILVGGTRDGWHDFDAEMPGFSDTFDRPTGDERLLCREPMLMFFSSGTTGYPKIVEHSHTYSLGHFVTAKYWHKVERDGLHLTISDTGWGKALWGKLYGQWLCEGAIFTYDFEKFDAHDILPMFKDYNITTFCAPPTMYRFFIKEDLSKYDLSSLHYATVAGEALNPEVFQQFYNATGVKIMEGFGQTETTLAVCNQIGMTPKPGSMGLPSPLYDIDIVDANGKSTKVGETGEIVIRTDKKIPYGLFNEYYLDEEKTKQAWHDGIYHTGDTAWRDEDGYYWYVGRVDDLIKSSGYRIGPFEIESVIMELPYVLECAVTGVPDELRGQLVKASIVLTKGTTPSEELKKEIQNYVKTHTAPYKYPRIVEFLTELPKTISGKIIRAQLRNNG